jgi:Dimerisation and cyclophilin-binding domain of Mon2
MAHSQEVKKLLDHLQSDLKNISLEAKRRHPGVKESAEEAIVKESNFMLHHVITFVH